MKHPWLMELQKHVAPVSEPVPKGFVTLEEASKESGIPMTTLKRRLVRAVEAGLVERITLKRFNGVYGQGACLREKFYYRWKKK